MSVCSMCGCPRVIDGVCEFCFFDNEQAEEEGSLEEEKFED